MHFIIIDFQYPILQNEIWADLKFNYCVMVFGKQNILWIKDTNFSTLSTDWTLLNLNILSQSNYGIKIVYSGITSPDAYMCFSDIDITHTIS